MRLSCGVILHDHEKMVIGHATNTKRFDIPKGGIDEGESELDCAIREVQEETGIKLHASRLVPLGRFRYLPVKDLFLFDCKIDLPRLSQLHCSSFFNDRHGKKVYEFDAFMYVTIKEAVKYIHPVIHQILLSEYKDGFDAD
jgi:8-oxo-dGTP pyrophosphatase MutT (NUDIX family)